MLAEATCSSDNGQTILKRLNHMATLNTICLMTALFSVAPVTEAGREQPKNIDTHCTSRLLEEDTNYAT